MRAPLAQLQPNAHTIMGFFAQLFKTDTRSEWQKTKDELEEAYMAGAYSMLSKKDIYDIEQLRKQFEKRAVQIEKEGGNLDLVNTLAVRYMRQELYILGKYGYGAQRIRIN